MKTGESLFLCYVVVLKQLIGFGSRIDGTNKFTDILTKGKPKFIELKSVKRGVGADDLTDELNVLSGLNSNPLKNRTQFVDQFENVLDFAKQNSDKESMNSNGFQYIDNNKKFIDREDFRTLKNGKNGNTFYHEYSKQSQN